MRIELNPNQIQGESGKGLEIVVKGFNGNPTEEEPQSQVYVEFYDGKLAVHVWDGSGEDPQTIKIEPLSSKGDQQ